MPDRKNYFRDHLAKTDDRMLFKMDHYLDVYADLLRDWQARDISFLEIGVYKGGSMPLWQGFFGQNAKLTFLDIDPACKALEMPGTTVEIGDQTDREFLARVSEAHGPFDIIVDDGGHKMDQQRISFESLWPKLADRGLYIVEDVHTSYWPGFGGGYRNSASFIEFSKDLIDKMNSWYTDQDKIFQRHPLASQIGSVRFWDSMIVIEKHLKSNPVSLTAQNGKVNLSTRMLEVRNRVSVF
jgi:hypothetical protein